MTEDLISRAAAIEALWEALHEYEDKTERQFKESDSLDASDWILHRTFVQNMSDIDRQTIRNLPTAQSETALADVMAKYEMLKEHCEILEKANEQLRKTIVYMAVKRMEDEE